MAEEDNDLDKRRWDSLLRWLSEKNGMDVSGGAFHVEAKEVQGASPCPWWTQKPVAHSCPPLPAGAGRGLFASRDCPVSSRSSDGTYETNVG